ncbi:MAG: DUF1223 domain-containing protein [Betaproteobacteria bacterium HGW-Betaproteobacteria-12]|nr:MAG: DUF1223 domain-containing protein [Betaproteobacteria bacterium HGW-Betaproteobacteria-12]
MNFPWTLLMFAGLAVPLASEAATCSRQSPAHTVALIELYTSEGCSSCPPADRWLRDLPQKFGADQLVALALHVDYWDYIGWQDPFASAKFTERQRQLSNLAGGSTIYTPEVFAGMRELRSWRNQAELEQRIKRINAQPAAAQIKLQMRSTGGSAVDVEASFALAPATPRGAAQQGIVAFYENNLLSAVRAGENQGVSLQHDRVVRFWSAPVVIDAQSGRATWKQTVNLPADWKRENLGVAALVQDAQLGQVLQAVAMPACF